MTYRFCSVVQLQQGESGTSTCSCSSDSCSAVGGLPRWSAGTSSRSSHPPVPRRLLAFLPASVLGMDGSHWLVFHMCQGEKNVVPWPAESMLRASNFQRRM